MVAPLKVGIAGLGTVGAEVVRLIEQQSRILSARCGRGVRVVAVTARSKAKKRSLDLRGVAWAKNALALASDPGIDCFVELMGGSGEPALSAIEAALNGPDDCIREMRDTYRKRRDALVESFGRAGWEIPPPEASMFAWAPLPEAFRGVGSMQFATLMVEKSGVVVSPGVAFGEHGEGYVRIAMVENEQRIRQAARGVRRFLESGIETLHNVVPLANRR